MTQLLCISLQSLLYNPAWSLYSFGCMSRVHSPFPTCACTFFCFRFRQWLAGWTTLNRTNGTDGQEGLNEDSSGSDGRCIVSELWLLVTLMETQPPPFNLFLQYVRSESSGPFLFFKKKVKSELPLVGHQPFPFFSWADVLLCNTLALENPNWRTFRKL